MKDSEMFFTVSSAIDQLSTSEKCRMLHSMLCDETSDDMNLITDRSLNEKAADAIAELYGLYMVFNHANKQTAREMIIYSIYQDSKQITANKVIV